MALIGKNSARCLEQRTLGSKTKPNRIERTSLERAGGRSKRGALLAPELDMVGAGELGISQAVSAKAIYIPVLNEDSKREILAFE